MSVSNSISRLTAYFKRHGLAATVHRAQLAAGRALFADHMVVFYYDLNQRRSPQVNIPIALRVARLTALVELSAEHLQAMTSFWNPKLADRNIRERFEKGASLWLVECEEQLAGYGWTLQGRTIEPYYFPLAQDDIHLFDFHVFPHYRGRGINPYLICSILDSLSQNCGGRAFIEAAEWNDPQLSSLRKTPFRRLGSARSFTVLSHTFVSWTKNDTDVKIHKGAKSAEQILRTARSNEQ
jgi:ribosomal protein S18 acetylase RimI-like enzyme